MFYLITLSIAGLSAAVCTVVIGRHWKEIRLLDPDSIKEEQVRQKREQLIRQRFDRLSLAKIAPAKAIVQHGVLLGKKAFHASYLKLIQIDRFYKQAKAPFALMAPSSKDRIRTLLDEARSLARDLKWADAERRFLEILTIDDRNLEAYKGLATIYVKQKLYTQAKETYAFLMKMKKADATCYEGLGQIAEVEGDMGKAEEMYQKALNLQPKSSHRHAMLADFFLSRNEPVLALPFARQAVELEQKSPKYLETLLEIVIRLGQRDDARRCYDRLRLLSEDRVKMDSFKERIDEISQR